LETDLRDASELRRHEGAVEIGSVVREVKEGALAGQHRFSMGEALD
jgi:hypothetical protein